MSDCSVVVVIVSLSVCLLRSAFAFPGYRSRSVATSAARIACQKKGWNCKAPPSCFPAPKLFTSQHSSRNAVRTLAVSKLAQQTVQEMGARLSSTFSFYLCLFVCFCGRARSCEGVDKIRLTGGEPTLRHDLLDIVKELSSIPGIREVGRLHVLAAQRLLCSLTSRAQ